MPSDSFVIGRWYETSTGLKVYCVGRSYDGQWVFAYDERDNGVPARQFLTNAAAIKGEWKEEVFFTVHVAACVLEDGKPLVYSSHDRDEVERCIKTAKSLGRKVAGVHSWLLKAK